MRTAKFSVLGPLMGGHGSQAFLGQEVGPKGPVRPVVMVFLPDEVTDSPDLFERVLEETKIAVRIDHRNVIAVHGLAKLHEGYARIVEFADGESMRAIFRKVQSLGRRMPPAIASAILSSAAMGVHYAHELGIAENSKPLLHGGLRPETMLVSFGGMAKVTGYGAALIAEGVARARGAESSVRDPYTAPEQIFGGRRAATAQTDVYGLGAVLYEALSGKPPFGYDTSLAQAITTSKPSEQLLADIPAGLAEIVLRAMDKAADQRFASAMEFAHALLDLGTPATEQQIADFMEELFPADTPQRMARNSLLEGGKDSPVTAVESPVMATAAGSSIVPPQPLDRPIHYEKTQPHGMAIPPVHPVPTPTGEMVQMPPVFPTPTPEVTPASNEFEETTPTAITTPQQAPPAAAPATPPPAAVAPTPAAPVAPPPAAAAPAPVAPVPAAPAPVAAPVPQAPLPQAPLPQPPPVQPMQQGSPFGAQLTQEVVVYRTHPALYIGLGLFGGVALVLATVFIMRSEDKPEPVVTPVVQVQPAEPKPQPKPDAAVAKEPKVEPVAKPATKIGKRPVKKRQPRVQKDPAPTSPPAEIGMGVLIIQAPPQSEVFIDGRRVGTAPVEPIDLKAGRHKVMVRQAGTGIEYKRAVKVKANLDLTLTVGFYND